jgi:hypothetical protein
MKIGYAFWGYLGDEKYDEKLNKVSTPDGNAFYSWSIIKAFQDAGDTVFSLMPKRDASGFSIKKDELFSSWCKEERSEAYRNLFEFLDVIEFGIKLDMILLEWRWEIKGRNEIALEGSDNWQPDLKLRNFIIEYARENGIPLVVFDLDYKLTEEDIKNFGLKYVIELGDKWKNSSTIKSKKVFIPFDFNCINYFQINDNVNKNLVYVGNRYERDWCIDKYIPEDLDKVEIYGNWKESGRDSEKKWSKLNFKNRLQTSEMHEVYSSSTATILLAKEEYCRYNFMTARIIEAIFYGTVPIFIEEYGEGTIREYAGMYSNFLTASSKEEVKAIINCLNSDLTFRKNIIAYLRSHLRFMDCKFFVNDVKSLVKE